MLVASEMVTWRVRATLQMGKDAGGQGSHRGCGVGLAAPDTAEKKSQFFFNAGDN